MVRSGQRKNDNKRPDRIAARVWLSGRQPVRKLAKLEACYGVLKPIFHHVVQDSVAKRHPASSCFIEFPRRVVLLAVGLNPAFGIVTPRCAVTLSRTSRMVDLETFSARAEKAMGSHRASLREHIRHLHANKVMGDASLKIDLNGLPQLPKTGQSRRLRGDQNNALLS
jgi:hypothetical protein